MIRFGTDGWRAVIAEEFTFANVRRVSAGVATALRGAGEGAVVIGHDTRFLSRAFAQAAAETILAAGRPVILTDGACPTPAVSCRIVSGGAPFGIVITASHNPSHFNGIKVKDSSGSSAGPEVTDVIEREIPESVPPRLDLEEGRRGGSFSESSFFESHRERLARMVDIEGLRASRLAIVTDSMHGASGTLLSRLLEGGRCRVATLHADPDPLFGGLHPEPLERNLTELKRAVVDTGAHIGVATDGDGDRIGAFDEKGQFVSPLRIAPLLAWSLIKKGKRGPLGKTFANTILLDRIARRYGLPFTTFPVGFKHIAREMKAGRMLLGGEESGGIGVEGFIPERDGTLVSLMLVQAMVDEGKQLSALVEDLCREFGELHYRRQDLPVPTDEGRRLVERLKAAPPATMGGLRVTDLDELDGLKLILGDDGWILFRTSGTEPVLRVYSEAPTADRLDAIMKEAIALVS